MKPTSFRWSAVTIDCTDPQRVSTFWAGLLGLAPRAALPGWVKLGAAVPGAPVINFQPVTQPKRDKTRTHLDLTVNDIELAAAAVTRLGGRSLDERHDYDEGVVVVMADPEGNEFCLVQYY